VITIDSSTHDAAFTVPINVDEWLALKDESGEEAWNFPLEVRPPDTEAGTAISIKTLNDGINDELMDADLCAL